MTTPDTATLRPDLLARHQEAQVQDDEAKARKAAADAATSELTLTQARYKALVPDLTGVTTNAVTDKSAGVAFSGLVTHSALNNAAKVIADRIAAKLTGPDQGRQPVILVTSQTDLLTSDLLSTTVKACLKQLLELAKQVLALTEPTELAPSGIAAGAEQWFSFLLPPTTAGVAAPSGAAAAGVVGLAGLGPVGLAAAAAAAVPSIISLFSSTTTVKDHTEDITDLTTTTSVLAAVADKLSGYTLVHEDFRLAPEKSQIREDYRLLADRRARLIIRQQQMQAIKNGAGAWLSGLQVTDEELARYGAQQPEPEAEPAPEAAAASEAESRAAVREELESVSAEADQLAQQDAERQAERVAWIDEAGINEPVVRFDSVSAAAALPVISGAITSIDEFTTAVNATAAGARSPLAIASLNELLHQGGADGISYVLSVKVLGGRSEQYTKDRRVGFDTYTTLADASVSFMLYDVADQKIIKSGIANGVSSVHGRLGKPLPNAVDAIKELAADAPPTNQSGQPPGPRKKWWRP